MKKSYGFGCYQVLKYCKLSEFFWQTVSFCFSFKKYSFFPKWRRSVCVRGGERNRCENKKRSGSWMPQNNKPFDTVAYDGYNAQWHNWCHRGLRVYSNSQPRFVSHCCCDQNRLRRSRRSGRSCRLPSAITKTNPQFKLLFKLQISLFLVAMTKCQLLKINFFLA